MCSSKPIFSFPFISLHLQIKLLKLNDLGVVNPLFHLLSPNFYHVCSSKPIFSFPFISLHLQIKLLRLNDLGVVNPLFHLLSLLINVSSPEYFMSSSMFSWILIHFTASTGNISY